MRSALRAYHPAVPCGQRICAVAFHPSIIERMESSGGCRRGMDGCIVEWMELIILPKRMLEWVDRKVSFDRVAA